ncbi:helix-turn-helix domain-containing protein [Leptospira wolffii]|uniref:Helix-turn-helix domain-containing protein n=1 Tax=Leptospira wolffii TaxID=409998 RepID=A0A2M9ZHA6_9LEPT|nr:XRE family transcriptional regulator [Leptospira wolffii]EPG64189.1 DNA-binding helix-turn-helix protein [Leptospira wolffii serovar Khorat str. Khorat-H2]PJZ67717.1 XRE family transcriptional regulator [Leptospira wolffii]TGK62727.1 XRE family transcriptional regulator [Leptospira wolffii]TGK73886.1 XRE family transcriptional regulator [Leptospira wolffii]TGK75041.1 XRE family transcriptional regulator [Leptospira wolffii]
MPTVDPIERGLIQSIGTLVRKRRQELGLSLGKLAELSQVSRGMLSLVESGKATPSIALLWKISKAIRLPLSSLMEFSKEELPKIYRKEDSLEQAIEGGVYKIRPLLHEETRFQTRLFEIRLSSGVAKTFITKVQSKQRQSLYLQSGSLRLKVGGKWFDLEEGDSMTFLGKDLQELANLGEKDSLILWSSALSED